MQKYIKKSDLKKGMILTNDLRDKVELVDGKGFQFFKITSGDTGEVLEMGLELYDEDLKYLGEDEEISDLFDLYIEC